MKKKQLINLIIFAILVAGGIFLAFQDFDSSSTLGDDELAYDMAIEDTAAVTKFVIINREPDTAILERTNNGWIVNGKYPARQGSVDEVLRTLHLMELRNFPTEAARETVLRRMAGYGRTLQVYVGDELVRDIIIGTQQNDGLGTWMMKRNARTPVAMHVPSENAFLESRFFAREDLWRNRIIFGWPDTEIAEMTMDYQLVPQEGYRIVQTEDSKLAVYDDANIPIEPFDSQHARYLLGSLRTLRYEGAIIETDEAFAKQDSIINSVPVFEMTLKNFDGETKKLSAFHVPAAPDEYDDMGNPRKYDVDRFYAKISDGRFVLIQTYAFENVLKTREYFNL